MLHQVNGKNWSMKGLNAPLKNKAPPELVA